MGISKKKAQGMDPDSAKVKPRKKVKEFNVVKETKKGEHYTDSRSPDSKESNYLQASGNSVKVRNRMTPIGMHAMSTSKRLENQFGHSDLYNQIIKSRKEK